MGHMQSQWKNSLTFAYDIIILKALDDNHKQRRILYFYTKSIHGRRQKNSLYLQP